MTDTLDERLDNRAAAIVELLADSSLRRPRRLRSAEFRKNLDRLYTAIRDTQRLRRARLLTPDTEARLEHLLLAPADLTTLNSDALGLMLETIDQALIESGDERLVDALLAIEYVRDADEHQGDIPTWRTIHGDARPTELDDQKLQLAKLLRARHAVYALRRAREGTRAGRLVWLAPILAALAAVSIGLTDALSDASWRTGVLAAVLGAAGATVAAGLKLRDALARLSALRTFWYAFALQIAVGAVAGLFMWIVLESRFVEVGAPGEDWAIAAAVAFVAGFSEPFLLKTIERIAGGGRDGDNSK